MMLLLLLFISTSLQANTVIFEHSGNTNPINENWLIGGAGSIGIQTGPISNDIGSGQDAWFVNDTSTVGGSNQSYYQMLSSNHSNQANTFGWTLSTTIRIPNVTAIKLRD